MLLKYGLHQYLPKAQHDLHSLCPREVPQITRFSIGASPGGFFWGKKMLSAPNKNIGANIRIGRESWCLPYAGFFKSHSPPWVKSPICTRLEIIAKHGICFPGNFRSWEPSQALLELWVLQVEYLISLSVSL